MGLYRTYSARWVYYHGYLKNRPVEEQSEQLDEVKEDVAVFLLYTNDVGQSEGPFGVDASVGRGGPGEESKLEKVLHHNSQLRETEKKRMHPSFILFTVLSVKPKKIYLH